jgi:hypothetical protein
MRSEEASRHLEQPEEDLDEHLTPFDDDLPIFSDISSIDSDYFRPESQESFHSASSLSPNHNLFSVIRCERCDTDIESYYQDLEPEVFAHVSQIITEAWIDLVLVDELEEPGYQLCPNCQ